MEFESSVVVQRVEDEEVDPKDESLASRRVPSRGTPSRPQSQFSFKSKVSAEMKIKNSP